MSTTHHRADIEVSHDGDKVKLKAPDGGTALTGEEAQELAGRILESASKALGDDPAENGWVRIPMQYLRFSAEKMEGAEDDEDPNKVPAPDSDEPDGNYAEVHCWIKLQTETNARHIASGTIAEHGWLPTELVEQTTAQREDFEGEYQEYYDKALAEDEVFLYEISDDDDNPEGSADGS